MDEDIDQWLKSFLASVAAMMTGGAPLQFPGPTAMALLHRRVAGAATRHAARCACSAPTRSAHLITKISSASSAIFRIAAKSYHVAARVRARAINVV